MWIKTCLSWQSICTHNACALSHTIHYILNVLCTAPSAPPRNLSVISMSSTTITLSWDPPLSDQTNGYILHYVVVVTEHETASEFQEQSNYTQVTLQFLHPFYTYTCHVAAVTTGPGPYTGNITIQLPEDGKISLHNVSLYLTTYLNKVEVQKAYTQQTFNDFVGKDTALYILQRACFELK